MARPLNKLSVLEAKNLAEPGYHADGGGLYLQVSKVGTKSWIFRYKLHKPREMGLGPYPAISLAAARESARQARSLVAQGIDPIDHRRGKRSADASASATRKTFKECAELCIRAMEPEWRNAKHAEQWRNTLETYAYPKIGDVLVADVATEHVIEVLEPIWTKKTETASRVRGRIERVLSWAAARGLRAKDNPAQWRGHLDALLARPSKVKKVRHHERVAPDAIGRFTAALREHPGVAALAIEFLLLTASRANEVARARWEEIDLERATWTIPAARTKASREHRVPLPRQALAVLKRAQTVRDDSDYVFPSPSREGKPITDAALLAVVKGLGGASSTTHGFRSTFRDWVAEYTNYPNIVAEAALAHVVSDKTESAYRRGDLFERRRKMMADWAKFCDSPSAEKGKVLPLRKAAS